MEIIHKKLILLIQTFSAKEIKLFRQFISSPFFTNGRNYIPFLEELLKMKDGTGKHSNKNKANESDIIKILSGRTLSNRYSELYKLGEEFLIYKSLKNNKAEKNKILLKRLLEEKLYSSYNTKHIETLKHFRKEKFTLHNSEDIAYISKLNTIFLHDKNRTTELYNEYYKNSKLILCISMLSVLELGLEFSHQELNNIKYEPNFVHDFLKKLEINEIIKDFSKSDSVIEKVTAMYFKLYKAFENEVNEKYFFESHKIFQELFTELNDSYKVTTYSHMINYCIRKQNKGLNKYKHVLFKLYKEKLSQDLTEDLENDLYLFNQFRDYVYIGISIKEFGWVENFIAGYSKLLPDEIRESEIKLSFANLNFARRLFAKSLSYVESIKTSHYLSYMDSSILKLCNYYELKNFEEAILEHDRLTHYLRNHYEIPEIYKLHYGNFAKFFQGILKMNVNPGKVNSGFLEKEIINCHKLSKKDWLLEKLRQLGLIDLQYKRLRSKNKRL